MKYKYPKGFGFFAFIGWTLVFSSIGFCIVGNIELGIYLMLGAILMQLFTMVISQSLYHDDEDF